MHLAQVSQVVLGQTDDTLLVAYEGGRATVPDRTLSQLALHYGVPAQDLSEFLTATRTKID